MVHYKTEEYLVGGETSFSQGTNIEARGGVQGKTGGLKGLIVARPRRPLLFQSDEQYGGGLLFSRRWTRDKGRRSTMVEISEFSWGSKHGIEGGGAFLPDNFFGSDGVQKNEWSFPVSLRQLRALMVQDVQVPSMHKPIHLNMWLKGGILISFLKII